MEGSPKRTHPLLHRSKKALSISCKIVSTKAFSSKSIRSVSIFTTKEKHTNNRQSIGDHHQLILLPVAITSSSTWALTSSTICYNEALPSLELAAIQCRKKEISQKIIAQGDEMILLLKMQSFLLHQSVQQTPLKRNHITFISLLSLIIRKFSLKSSTVHGICLHFKPSLITAHMNTTMGQLKSKWSTFSSELQSRHNLLPFHFFLSKLIISCLDPISKH
jgi:hypothetical protein